MYRRQDQVMTIKWDDQDEITAYKITKLWLQEEAEELAA